MQKRSAAALMVTGWRWWTGELARMLPRRRGSRGDGRADVLLLDVGDRRVTASRCANGRCQEVASAALSAGDHAGGATALAGLANTVDPARTPVLIRIPPREVLTRVVHLPPAAAENLREVLSFEMHRRTPFTADAVYFDFRALPMQPGDQMLRVELSLVRRELVDAVVALLPPWDLRVMGATEMPAIEAEGMLLRLAVPHRGATRRRALTRLLWAGNAALLAAVVAIPLVQQERAIDALEARVAAAGIEAQGAAALSRRAEEVRAERRAIIDEKRDRPAMVAVVAELTATLPDSTWVQRLEIKHRRVRLRGTSTTASALIPIIENSPLFRGAAFDAPVTRNPATGEEQFQLVFEISSANDANEEGNGRNLQKSAGAIAAAGRLHRLR